MQTHRKRRATLLGAFTLAGCMAAAMTTAGDRPGMSTGGNRCVRNLRDAIHETLARHLD